MNNPTTGPDVPKFYRPRKDHPLFSIADRQQLTPCCGRFSTYDCDSGVLYCKKCYCEVQPGEGDGSAHLSPDGLSLVSNPQVHQLDLATGKLINKQVAPATIGTVGEMERICDEGVVA